MPSGFARRSHGDPARTETDDEPRTAPFEPRTRGRGRVLVNTTSPGFAFATVSRIRLSASGVETIPSVLTLRSMTFALL